MTTAIDGIWKLDFYGNHGWETVGTLSLIDGKVSGGSITHFTTGTYTTVENGVTLNTNVHFYGSHKPFFGRKANRVSVILDGTIDGDTISGKEHCPQSPAHSYPYRMTKQAGIP